MKKELKSGILSADKSADCLPTVGGVNVIAVCDNKYADHLRSNYAADQRLCFRYTDSTIPLLPSSEIPSL